MAGTAVITNQYLMGDVRVNLGLITAGSVSTIEVPTNLARIDHASFVEIGSADAVDVPNINETVTLNGNINVSSGLVTVEWVGTNKTYMYQFIGV